MKLLYCHDNEYFKDADRNIYSQGQFPASYFKPFLQKSCALTVLGREKPLSADIDKESLNISSAYNINFALMPNINTVKGFIRHRIHVEREISKLVAKHDRIIIRAVSDLGWIAYKHARRMNKPIAMEMSACAWDSTWNHGHPLGKLYAPIRHYRDKAITKHASYVLYVSQNFLQKRYPTRGITASASNVRIDNSSDNTLAKRLEKIAALNPEKPLNIGLIGTLGHKLKGVNTALNALKRIENQSPGKFTFKVLGPGRTDIHKQKVRKLGLEHCVKFEKAIPSGQAILDWLEDIDLYIQPSFQEGVPRAMIEAMSMGCPCIGSTAGGIPELLSADILHTPGDGKALASLITKFLNNKNIMRQHTKENFIKSNQYASTKLAPIRNQFWLHFIEHKNIENVQNPGEAHWNKTNLEPSTSLV